MSNILYTFPTHQPPPQLQTWIRFCRVASDPTLGSLAYVPEAPIASTYSPPPLVSASQVWDSEGAKAEADSSGMRDGEHTHSSDEESSESSDPRTSSESEGASSDSAPSSVSSADTTSDDSCPKASADSFPLRSTRRSRSSSPKRSAVLDKDTDADAEYDIYRALGMTRSSEASTMIRSASSPIWSTSCAPQLPPLPSLPRLSSLLGLTSPRECTTDSSCRMDNLDHYHIDIASYPYPAPSPHLSSPFLHPRPAPRPPQEGSNGISRVLYSGQTICPGYSDELLPPLSPTVRRIEASSHVSDDTVTPPGPLGALGLILPAWDRAHAPRFGHSGVHTQTDGYFGIAHLPSRSLLGPHITPSRESETGISHFSLSSSTPSDVEDNLLTPTDENSRLMTAHQQLQAPRSVSEAQCGHYRDLSPISFDHPDPFAASPSVAVQTRQSMYNHDQDIDPLCTPPPHSHSRVNIIGDTHPQVNTPIINRASPLRRLAMSMSELHLPRAFRVLLPSEVVAHRLSEPTWSPRSLSLNPSAEVDDQREIQPRRSFADLLRGRTVRSTPQRPTTSASMARPRASSGVLPGPVMTVSANGEEEFGWEEDGVVMVAERAVAVPAKKKTSESIGAGLRRKMSTALGLGLPGARGARI